MLPYGVNIFADKVYQTEKKPIKMQENNKVLLISVKKKKRQKSLLSRAISSVRHPVETLY
jgi:hypothetical protein